MILPRNHWAHCASWLAVVLGIGAAPAALRGQTVAEVQVTPETMTLGVGGKQPIFAAAYDRQGNLIPTAKFTFWSSDTAIVQVLRDGMVMGIRPGLAKVEARVQRRHASLAVLVTGRPEPGDDRPPPGAVLTLEPAALSLLPGETGHMTPRATRDDGSPLAIGRVTWKSLNPAAVEVDTAGTLVGVAPGRSIIQVTTSTGLMATAPVEVAAAEFVVVPNRLVLAAQDADTLRARVPSQGDRRLGGDIRWRSLDSTVAQVDPAGVVRAESPGTTEVVAAGLGQERRIPVIVHKAPESLVISPPQRERLQVPRNGRRKFSVVVEAADSTPIAEIRPRWTLRDSTTAVFDAAAGTLTAKALGTTTLTATVPGFQPVVWTVEVIPGFVRLSRDRLGLAPGERATVEATLIDDAGLPVGAISELRWTSDRPDVIAVDSDGTIHGVAPGRATVVATAAWGQSDTVVVFVTADFLVTSNRGGSFGIYGVRQIAPDSFLPVLTDRGANIHGVYSPDRTRLAFSSNRAGTYDLYVADADGGNPRQVTSGRGDETNPVWTPDGTRLLYIAADSARDPAPEVRIVEVGDSTPRDAAASPAGGSWPAISHDGAVIAFVATRDKDPDLYLVPLGGGVARRLTTNSERELLPAFFPNGDLLYAVERGRGKAARVLRRSPIADRVLKLFDIDQPLAALALSRDGTTIAYATGKTAGSKGRANFSLHLRPATPEGTAVVVPLRLNEQILSIAF